MTRKNIDHEIDEKESIKKKTILLANALEKCKPRISQVLPSHLSVDKMLRVILMSVKKTPDLLQCTPSSVLNSVMIAAQVGIEQDSVLGGGYLIPYWNTKTKMREAQFQISYRGLMDLAYRSAKIYPFEAHVVHKNEPFKCVYGLNPVLEHSLNFDNPSDEIICVYALAGFEGKRAAYDVMTKKEVDYRRDRSPGGKSPSSPWQTYYEEMAKKTVIKRLCKSLPLSVELRDAIKFDNQAESQEGQEPVIDLGEFEEFDEQDASYKKVDSAIDRITQQLESQPKKEVAYEND